MKIIIRFFLFCSFLLITQLSKSENAEKPILVKENRAWNTRISSPVMPYYHTERTRITFLQGDTLINETGYIKAYRSFYEDKSQAGYAGCLRQDGDKVYIIGKDKTAEILLYDFGLEAGDSFTFDSSFEDGGFIITETVSATDSITIGGIKHKRVLFSQGEHGAWIEGIGSTDDIMTHYTWNIAGGPGYHLLCCFGKQGEKMYQSGVIEETFIQKPQDNMIGEGTKWTDEWNSQWAGGGQAHYFIEGDSLINSELYWKVNLEGFEQYNPFVLMREDRDSTIYIRFLYNDEEFRQIKWETQSGPDYLFTPEKNKDWLLYSFGNWKIGETLPYIQDGSPMTQKITHIGSKLLADGVTYKTINNIIQTVGSEEGILNPYIGHPTNGTYFYLGSYYRKGTEIFSTSSITETKNQIRVSQPEKGTVVFNLGDKAGSQTICLFDSSGTPVRTVQANGLSEVVIGNLQQGLYLYEIGGNRKSNGKIAVW